MKELDTLTSKQFAMFLRVQRFGVENATEFPETSTGGELFTDLDQLIAEMSAAVANQDKGEGRAATISKNTARQALLDDLKAIARTARSLENTIPELRGKFKIETNPSNQNLLAAARAFASYAAPHREKFAKFDLPENFLDDLAADIAAFDHATSHSLGALNNRTTATRTLKDVIVRAVSTVRDLDTVINNRFRKNPLKLEQWNRAKTVQRGTGRGAAQPAQPSDQEGSVAA